MTQEQALNLLIQAVFKGQEKGAYLLPEAKLIAEAVEIFTQPKESVETKEEDTKQD